MEFVISFLLAALVTWLIVFVPPYEKWVYEKTPAVSQQDIENSLRDDAGYRADSTVKVATTFSDMRKNGMSIAFTLRINKSQLHPTGIYENLNKTEFETNKTKIFLTSGVKCYAQFYILTLEDESKIPILINDRIIDTNKEDIIEIPVCYANSKHSLGRYYQNIEIVEKIYDISPQLSGLCINSVDGFLEGKEMKKFRSKQTTAAIIVFLIVLFGSVILLFSIGKAMGKGNK